MIQEEDRNINDEQVEPFHRNVLTDSVVEPYHGPFGIKHRNFKRAFHRAAK